MDIQLCQCCSHFTILFWSDYFIDEKYESSPSIVRSEDFYSPVIDAYTSPGVYNNIVRDGPNAVTMESIINKVNQEYEDFTTIEYAMAIDQEIMNFIYNQISSETFLGKLFDIGIEVGAINLHKFEDSYFSTNPYINEYLVGINGNGIFDILTNYFDNNPKLSNKVSVTKLLSNNIHDPSETERLRTEIIRQVVAGTPVLVGGENIVYQRDNGIVPSKNRHTVIAYDYDETNDILYGNMGWSNEMVRVNLDTYFYSYIDYCLKLNVAEDFEKTMSNNYIFSDHHCYYSAGFHYEFNMINYNDFDFPQAYGDGTHTSETDIVLARTNEEIHTTRLRCCKIYGECINLSPKRYSEGEAFLLLEFDKPIASVVFNMSWWSENENVTRYNSQYKIEYFYNGEFNQAVDLWNDISLSYDKNNPTSVCCNFLDFTSKIKVSCNVLNGSYSSNKGRLSIFNIYVRYY